MNPPIGSPGSERDRPPLSDAAKASLMKTHTLFRIFILAVVGSFFVLQLDVSYLWLTALLTAAGLVLGVMVLIRAVKYKESRLVLVGTISGLLAATVMVLMILIAVVFFDHVRNFQQCSRDALTQQAASQCRTQLETQLERQLTGQLP